MLRSTGHSSIPDRTGNFHHPGIGPALALPQVWRSDGGHRTTYGCSTPTPFSTTVGHYCGMKRLAHNSKPSHGSPRPVPVRPAPDPIPTSRSPSHRFRISILASTPSQAPFLRFRAHSRQLQYLSLAPFNLHKARVRRASGFLLTAFSNARPQSSVPLHSAHQRRASEKALALFGIDLSTGLTAADFPQEDLN
jgi:hypothetical protein